MFFKSLASMLVDVISLYIYMYTRTTMKNELNGRDDCIGLSDGI